MPYCRHCGHEVGRRAKSCVVCGCAYPARTDGRGDSGVLFLLLLAAATVFTVGAAMRTFSWDFAISVVPRGSRDSGSGAAAAFDDDGASAASASAEGGSASAAASASSGGSSASASASASSSGGSAMAESEGTVPTRPGLTIEMSPGVTIDMAPGVEIQSSGPGVVIMRNADGTADTFDINSAEGMRRLMDPSGKRVFPPAERPEP